MPGSLHQSLVVYLVDFQCSLASNTIMHYTDQQRRRKNCHHSSILVTAQVLLLRLSLFHDHKCIDVYIKWLTIVEDVLMAVLDFRRRMVLTRRRFQMVARTCVLPENKRREKQGSFNQYPVTICYANKFSLNCIHSTPTLFKKN